ncbi:MAG: hypothetical protein WCC30_06765 [Candidatus Dormiibacterota bacterium]
MDSNGRTTNPTDEPDQFAWGLSNGIAVLAISGVFWLSLAAWAAGFGALVVALPPILIVGGILIKCSVQLRRRFPKFSPRSLRAAPKGSLTRRLTIGIYAVTTAQSVSIIWIGVICSALNRTDLIWPLIGLVISLHFLPLGWLFGVRPYYLLAVVGTIITVVSILSFTDGFRLVAVGLGLGVLTVASAVYLVANGESQIWSGALRTS